MIFAFPPENKARALWRRSLSARPPPDTTTTPAPSLAPSLSSLSSVSSPPPLRLPGRIIPSLLHIKQRGNPVSHRALLCVPKYCGCFWRGVKTTSATGRTQSLCVFCGVVSFVWLYWVMEAQVMYHEDD